MIQSISPKLYEWEKIPVTKRYRDKISGDIYGTMATDNEQGIREKLGLLAVIQAPFGLFVRIPYRVMGVLRGDFFSEGCHKAKREWKLERQVAYLGGNPVPGRVAFVTKASGKILWQLAKEIAKIVTYPLAIVALEFAALYGLFRPLDGRAMYASIEHFWSSNSIATFSWINEKNSFDKIRYGNYLAACLQPRRVLDDSNLYRAFPNFTKDSTKSQLLELKNYFMLNREFFSREGFEFDLEKKIELYLANQHRNWEQEGDESASGVKYDTATDAVKALIQSLEKTKQWREKVIQGNSMPYIEDEAIRMQLKALDSFLIRPEDN